MPTYLAPGSDPSVLPGPILIADKLNNRLIIVDPQGHIRWVWPQPGDLDPGETFLIPDDAFFSPDGRYIIATQEDDFVISVIDIATGKIVWRYGHPGVPGSGPGYVWNPDDAMILRNATVMSADIKNCRLIEIPLGAAAVSWQEGLVGSCVHNPPRQYGSPNGVFPLPNGHFLVTEINGDWVDEIDASGQVYWSAHPPHVDYPSDSNQIGADRYLTVDYSSPGQAVIFNQAGQALWRYDPSSAPAELNHPSLAMTLPNGDILLNDDHNHRVVVIDPSTNQIVWQYGHDGIAGSAPGYLDNPDGLDPLPPFSYADRFQPMSPDGSGPR
jgi:DNA-binding beta-propeller fold protein YncE